MDLEELKKLRKENFLDHKKRKREYYLKKKLESSIANKNLDKPHRDAINYENELQEDGFLAKLKEIAKKQKAHVDSRKDIIIAKLQEYSERKQQYYQENKDKRLEYDKEYRETKKEELRNYRKEYYQKNKDKILQKQKESRSRIKTTTKES